MSLISGILKNYTDELICKAEIVIGIENKFSVTKGRRRWEELGDWG